MLLRKARSHSEKTSDAEVRSGEEHAVLGDERSDVSIEVAGGLLTVCFLKRSWFGGIVFGFMTVICTRDGEVVADSLL